ncbi:hypothetical protein A3C89_03005 [Candidatus Kaiserbacteria bacterium RIFCSPHIGHO2_02_FULL_50_50]|uniref:Uncharacterized protein n=1 Tax=Candidatus Kaiserbacteria bacterium RIFCSPHIGHO2_02_FULL_50_50 TaxID=1798492 RepID=A0A1F6DCW6_9BACT|nr:MAG: hypothetical protein A3C89_03005 [Candidatus Kaiserbacteria bacterium RIFCSPHIGHO2_02_FULL_50_50]
MVVFMSHAFSSNLKNQLITYFKERYGVLLSDEEANTYLFEYSKFFLVIDAGCRADLINRTLNEKSI